MDRDFIISIFKEYYNKCTEEEQLLVLNIFSDILDVLVDSLMEML